MLTDEQIKEIFEFCRQTYARGVHYIPAHHDETYDSSYIVKEPNDFKIYSNDTIYAEPLQGTLYIHDKFARIIDESGDIKPVTFDFNKSKPTNIEIYDIF